ncbi:MAG: hypothetical protein ACRD3D_03755 [Terriglobia bacterium]
MSGIGKTPDLGLNGDNLIVRARRGEERALVALFDIHRASVYSLCARVVETRGEAESMTLDIFLAAFKGIGFCHDHGTFARQLFQLTAGAMTAHLCVGAHSAVA